MDEIKAFVGHSFAPDDAAVVDAFLRYFDDINRFHPLFSWVHAQEAEPRELVDKVLSLLEGRNLFIGICTKKERVISPGALKSGLFSMNSLVGKESDFQWKTSDWVIQEIGLAKGQGMALMLL
jgi:hypothetical protein